MESFFGRYKNPLVLMAALFIQIIGLATQVKRPSDPKAPNSPGTRLIRVWTVTAFTPFERAFVGTSHFFRNGWHNYVDVQGIRRQNQELQAEVTRLRMDETRMKEDAEQAHRLQTLLGFREKFISQTMAAQVIGTSGSEQSRVIYIDKGSHDGIKTDMAVITPDGIVGKVKDVFPLSSQVLMISDRDSGAGVLLEKSRLHGLLHGNSAGELLVDDVMADQTVDVGDQVIASGGDRIFPKGLPVGTVISVAPDRETGTFLTIKIKPAADLNRLEEVLVVTKMAEQLPSAAENEGRSRAADILAQRLPTVPKSDQQKSDQQKLDQQKPGATGTGGPVVSGEQPGQKKPGEKNLGENKNDEKKKPEAALDKDRGKKIPAGANATPALNSPNGGAPAAKVKPKKPAAPPGADSTPEKPPSDKKKTEKDRKST